MANSSTSMIKSSTTINDLPQHILIHILTFLYLPDAIGASLISRSFRNLWHLLPSLHFDIEEFYSRSTSPTPRCDHTRNVFAELVSQTLIFRQTNPLTKLKLTFEYTNNDIHKSNVQSWIRYAINLSVSELVLDFNENKFRQWKDPDDDYGDSDDDSESEQHQEDRWCEFDFYLFDIRMSRINVLKLYKCYLKVPPKTNPIKFVSLKSLLISGTSFVRDDVCNLLERCVNLEILKLMNVEFSFKEGLVIHSSTLKELYLYRCSKCIRDWQLDLDICCPRLQKISLVSSHIGKVLNKDTTHLVEACIDFRAPFINEEYGKTWEKMISCFTNITSIDVWDELLESKEVPAGCEQFTSNIKHLELYCYYNESDLVGLAALLKLLPKLEILVLNNQGTIDVKLSHDYRKASTVFNMPCLKKVIMKKYRNTKGERHLIQLFRKNGIVLDKIELIRPSNQIEHYKY